MAERYWRCTECHTAVDVLNDRWEGLIGKHIAFCEECGARAEWEPVEVHFPGARGELVWLRAREQELVSLLRCCAECVPND